MIRRRRSTTETTLVHGERFIQDETALSAAHTWSREQSNRGEEVAPKVPGHHDHVETTARQRCVAKISAPAVKSQPCSSRASHSVPHRVELHIDPKRSKAGLREQPCVTAVSHREIDPCARDWTIAGGRSLECVARARQPCGDEW
jgi:hypothetical protein